MQTTGCYWEQQAVDPIASVRAEKLDNVGIFQKVQEGQDTAFAMEILGFAEDRSLELFSHNY